MAFFSLIDNFFLLSVGLVFVLIFFIVYHFKTRISVAEQKTDTLFRLMTVMTRKVSSLFETSQSASETISQSNNNSNPQNLGSDLSPKPKSEPEVYEPIVLNLSATELASIPINLNRIVVSDSEDSESESDDESDSDESDSDESDEFDSDFDTTELPANFVEELEESPPDSLLVSETVLELIQFAEPLVNLGSEEELKEADAETKEKEDPEPKEEESHNEYKTEYSLDQLKKMNINQLKTIAIQNGICSDTTKIKKGELIQLIQKKYT